MRGGGGSMAAVYFFNMLIITHCIFIQGHNKSTFSKYCFGREGRGQIWTWSQKKSTLCTLLIMLTITKDPLPKSEHFGA